MPVDLSTMLWLELIVVVAAFVQGMVGFAFGMIAMGLGTIILDARTASIVVAPLAATNILIVLWSVRRDVRLVHVGPMVLGVLCGLPLGLVLLLGGGVSLIRVLVAALLMYVGVTRLLHRRVTPRRVAPWWGALAGLVGGVLGGAVNMSGPPLIAYAARQPWSPRTFKATLLTTFVIGTGVKTVALIWHGALDGPLLAMTGALLPAVLVGSYVGIHLFSRIDRERFGLIVALLLILLGVGLFL